ncbi:hypothetical protein D3C73_1198300 [compost metagenome]
MQLIHLMLHFHLPHLALKQTNTHGQTIASPACQHDKQGLPPLYIVLVKLLQLTQNPPRICIKLLTRFPFLGLTSQ